MPLDWSPVKENATQSLFAGLQALHAYRAAHNGDLPAVWDAAAAEEVLILARGFNEASLKVHSECQSVLGELLTLFVCSASCSKSSMPVSSATLRSHRAAPWPR